MQTEDNFGRGHLLPPPLGTFAMPNARTHLDLKLADDLANSLANFLSMPILQHVRKMNAQHALQLGCEEKDFVVIHFDFLRIREFLICDLKFRTLVHTNLFELVDVPENVWPATLHDFVRQVVDEFLRHHLTLPPEFFELGGPRVTRLMLIHEVEQVTYAHGRGDLKQLQCHPQKLFLGIGQRSIIAMLSR